MTPSGSPVFSKHYLSTLSYYTVTISASWQTPGSCVPVLVHRSAERCLVDETSASDLELRTSGHAVHGSRCGTGSHVFEFDPSNLLCK